MSMTACEIPIFVDGSKQPNVKKCTAWRPTRTSISTPGSDGHLPTGFSQTIIQYLQ